MSLTDAHNHLHDARLDGVRAEVIQAAREGGYHAVVNGTHSGDWARVAEVCAGEAGLIPAYGLHPWWVNEAAPDWREQLDAMLAQDPGAQIGEIGLDRWKEGFDIARQQEAFRLQMAWAVERGRTPSVHCLRAWGMMLETLREIALPEGGFLLHSYGGPVEMIPALVKLGASFSLSGYVAHARKEKARAVFRAVPIERLLVETDAPDMRGPEAAADYPPVDGAWNHPLNMGTVTRFAAALREMPEDEFVARVGENFQRLFGR